MKKRERIVPTYNVKYVTHDSKCIFEIRKIAGSKMPNRILVILLVPVNEMPVSLGSPLVIDNVFEISLNLYWLRQLDLQHGIFIDIPQEQIVK